MTDLVSAKSVASQVATIFANVAETQTYVDEAVRCTTDKVNVLSSDIANLTELMATIERAVNKVAAVAIESKEMSDSAFEFATESSDPLLQAYAELGRAGVNSLGNSVIVLTKALEVVIKVLENAKKIIGGMSIVGDV